MRRGDGRGAGWGEGIEGAAGGLGVGEGEQCDRVERGEGGGSDMVGG